MIKIYISNYHDVYTNIAIERYLFSNAKDDLILFLWGNKPCVVFGRNQNIFDEINIDYAIKNNIALARRFSGGGAVYQDEGNLNYTFICHDESEIDKLNKLLIKVFNNLDLDVNFSGRNDLLINDKKFSGIAYCNDFNHLMYHGTCLISSNLDELEKILKPHDYKLKSHGVKSYKSRVINLNEIKDINSDDIINCFITTLKESEEVDVINDIDINKDINDIINLLKDDDYIYNDCPNYEYEFDIKLHNSNYHFKLEYSDGVINNASIYSDDLDIKVKDQYLAKIINKKIPFKDIKEYLKNL